MTGHKRDRYGWRVFVKRNGRQREKRFPADASYRSRENWRKDTWAALGAEAVEPKAGTFAADVTRYLTLVSAMPTLAQRTAHLMLWVAVFGDRPRARIVAPDIRAVLHGWRSSGLSAATCNKRRTALMHLWSVLDGKSASNPVRDVPKFPVSDPLPRGRDPHMIDTRLRKAPRCRSRASARVLLWTGLRPVELSRAESDDVDLKRKIVLVRTAKGGRTRSVPLTPQAISAWKEFAAAKGWHAVPQAAPFNRWLKAVTKLPMRVYDLRHTYGTALARAGTRLDVIAMLMGHSNLEMARRYVLAAVPPDALAATRRLAGRAAGSRKTA